MRYTRIDGILANPDYNNVLDKEWKVVVSLVENTTGETIEQREITILKLAKGFSIPELSEVIKEIESCHSLDEVVELGQNNPSNSAYNKHKNQRTLSQER